MKFLVYGADGWIGSFLKDILLKAGDTVITGQRVTQRQHVLEDLAHHTPDYVICSVGRTYGPGNATIDYLEAPDKLLENIVANLTAPVLIAQATSAVYASDQSAVAKAAIPCLYIGSGCIFEYDAAHPPGGAGFTEESMPNFFGSSYSTVKGHTDTIMRGFPHVICARIRMPITDASHPRDFITKIISYKKICSIPNSMTILSEWLPLLIACLVEGKVGTINAVNPGVIEHKDILAMYEKIFRVKHEYELMTVEQQSAMLLAGRSNNYLTTAKAEEWIASVKDETRVKYGVPVRLSGIEEGIRRILEQRAATASNTGSKV